MNRSSVKKNVVLNVIKQLSSIIFPLLTYPYVARVLGSSKYGMYSFSDSIVNYFALIASLGISTYAVREGAKIRDDKGKITDLSSELFTINIISTIVSYVCLFFVITFNGHINRYSTIIWVRALIILLTTLGADWVNNIYEDFEYITIRYLIFQALSVLLMFLFVRSPNDLLIYTFITVLAAGGGNLLNIVYIRKYVHIKLRFQDLKRHIIPILVLFANNIAVTIYVNADITMLGFYTTDSEVGIYSLSSKIYNLTKLMINAVITVCVPRLAYIISDRKKYEDFLKKIFSSLLLFTVPVIVGLAILSKKILLLIGGSQYVKGYQSLSILSLAIIGAIGGSFFSNCILLQHNEEKNILKATLAAAIINTALNFAFIPAFGMSGAAITTVIAEAVACLIEYYYAKKYVKIKDIIDNNIFFIAAGSFAVALCCFVVPKFVENTLGCILLSICLSLVLYIGINIKNPLIESVFLKYRNNRKRNP